MKLRENCRIIVLTFDSIRAANSHHSLAMRAVNQWIKPAFCTANLKCSSSGLSATFQH